MHLQSCFSFPFNKSTATFVGNGNGNHHKMEESQVGLDGPCDSDGHVRPRGGSKGKTLSAPRCYCLLSRFPFFDMHFRVLYNLIGILMLFTLNMSVLFCLPIFFKSCVIIS